MLWSTRRSSSRQLVACDGEATKKLPKPGVGRGNIGNNGTARGSIGTRLPGKGVPVAGFTGQSVLGQTSLKSPNAPGVQFDALVAPGHPRSAADGVGLKKFAPGTTSRRHSCDQKKNVLLLSVL